MEHLTVKKVRFLPTLIVSVFLLAMAFGATKADASTINLQTQPSVQLAWWGGGWGHHWGGGWGWHRGWGGGGWGGGGAGCHCWINAWGHERCNCY